MTIRSDDPPLAPRCARLLSALTHELRTPLSSVLMLAEMMASETDGRLADRARTMHQVAEDMRTLLDQVARLARVASGRPPCAVEPLDTRRIAALISRGLDGSRITPPPAIRVASSLPPTVHADPERLVELIGILVNDVAVERTSTIEVVIRSDGTAEPSKSEVVIEVHHPSITVTSDQLDELFEPFQVRVQRIGRRHGGQTLGLALARATSHQMGAALAARADQNAGLVFVLSLPATG